MIRSALRRLRDRIATRGAGGRLQHIAGPELLVLTYHRVLPRDHAEWPLEQPGMLVSPETLDLHLTELKTHFELVHLDDWVAAGSRDEPLPRLACALTFDDGWRDNFDYAWPVLKRHSAPATIFLVTDLVGAGYAFWPNRLARALVALQDGKSLEAWSRELRGCMEDAGVEKVPVPAALIDAVIERCKQYSDAQIQSWLDDLGPSGEAGDARRDLLDWQEIQTMQYSGLVRFGSHTRRHTRLRPGLDARVLGDEVSGSAAILQRQLGQRPTLFCYPNGDYGLDALNTVASTYAAAVTTRTGWNDTMTPLHELRRVGLHEDVASNRAGLLYRLMAARG